MRKALLTYERQTIGYTYYCMVNVSFKMSLMSIGKTFIARVVMQNCIPTVLFTTEQIINSYICNRCFFLLQKKKMINSRIRLFLILHNGNGCENETKVLRDQCKLGLLELTFCWYVYQISEQFYRHCYDWISNLSLFFIWKLFYMYLLIYIKSYRGFWYHISYSISKRPKKETIDHKTFHRVK